MTMLMDQKEFSRRLLSWWQKNQRKYPWRNTRNPYHILVSEVLLHRTRADQVVPVYTQLVQKFTNIRDLANATETELKELLHTLGLHWRSELIHDMAREIVRRHNMKIPSETEELESLPGISHYIASAVRCFAFGRPDVLLDTNTVRVLGRIFGIKVTDSSRRSKQFRELARLLMDQQRPREFNYAMIDLGALLCKPANPLCDQCPVRELCKYGSSTYR